MLGISVGKTQRQTLESTEGLSLICLVVDADCWLGPQLDCQLEYLTWPFQGLPNLGSFGLPYSMAAEFQECTSQEG